MVSLLFSPVASIYTYFRMSLQMFIIHITFWRRTKEPAKMISWKGKLKKRRRGKGEGGGKCGEVGGGMGGRGSELEIGEGRGSRLCFGEHI